MLSWNHLLTPRGCGYAAVLALSLVSSGAFAAPSQLYGKSVVVSWVENRMQTTDVSPVPQSRTASAQLSVYVSDKGRAFSRVRVSVDSPRGARSAHSDAVQGEASARSLSFHGNSMTVTAPRGSAGALMIAVTFDAGFQGCSARVVSGKSEGAASTRITNTASGFSHDVFSIRAGGESCSVQNGNVFGN